MTEINRKIKRSAWASVLIGGPVGLITILATVSLPLLLIDEGLLTLAFYFSYGHATIGFIGVFIFSLWYAGKNAYLDLSDGRPLISASLKYSVTVNAFSWLAFIIIAAVDNYITGLFNWYILVPPILLSLICPVLTTFSLGLFICHIIKGQIQAPNSTYLNPGNKS